MPIVDGAMKISNIPFLAASESTNRKTRSERRFKLVINGSKGKSAKPARKLIKPLDEGGNKDLIYFQHNDVAKEKLTFLMEPGLPFEVDLTKEKASTIHPRDVKIVDKKSGQCYSMEDILVSFLLQCWSKKAVSMALSQVWFALDKLFGAVSKEPLWAIIQLFLKENRELTLKEIREKLNSWYVKTLGKPLSEYQIKSSNSRGKYVYVGYVRRLLNSLVTIGFLVEIKKKRKNAVRGYILNQRSKIVQSLLALYDAYIESLPSEASGKL